MKEVCVLQGSVVTFFRCDGQIYYHLCHVFPEFCVPKTVNFSLIFNELFKK